MIRIRHLPAEEAKALGYKPLTESFQMPAEEWCFDATLKQLDTGPNIIQVAVVENGDTRTIWRKGMRVSNYRARTRKPVQF